MPEFETFTNFVHAINSRAASEQYASRKQREEQYLRSKLPVDIDREWAGQLLEYYNELDRLREDWALEITGRYELFARYGVSPRALRILRKSRPVLAWLSKKFPGEGKWICHRSIRILFKTWQEWCFYEEHHILPLSLTRLQKQYMSRKKDIDAKYYRLLGYWNNVGKDRNQKEYFPTDWRHLCLSWPVFYLGQNCFQIWRTLAETPSTQARPWTTGVKMRGNDGKIFLRFTFLQVRDPMMILDAMDRWKQLGGFIVDSPVPAEGLNSVH